MQVTPKLYGHLGKVSVNYCPKIYNEHLSIEETFVTIDFEWIFHLTLVAEIWSLAKAPMFIFPNIANNIGWSTFFSKIITNCEECYLDCLFHISSNVQSAPDA